MQGEAGRNIVETGVDGLLRRKTENLGEEERRGRRC